MDKSNSAIDAIIGLESIVVALYYFGADCPKI